MITARKKKGKNVRRGHPDLNQGPLDLQSNALPLSYTPNLLYCARIYVFINIDALPLLYTTIHSLHTLAVFQ